MAQGNSRFNEQSRLLLADSDSTVTETSTVDQSDAISFADSCSEADHVSDFVCMDEELDFHPASSSFLGKRQANRQEVTDYFPAEPDYLGDCRNINPAPEGSDEIHPESSFMPPASLDVDFEPESPQNSPQSEINQLVLPPPKKTLKKTETNQSHPTMKPPRRP